MQSRQSSTDRWLLWFGKYGIWLNGKFHKYSRNLPNKILNFEWVFKCHYTNLELKHIWNHLIGPFQVFFDQNWILKIPKIDIYYRGSNDKKKSWLWSLGISHNKDKTDWSLDVTFWPQWSRRGLIRWFEVTLVHSNDNLKEKWDFDFLSPCHG